LRHEDLIEREKYWASDRHLDLSTSV